MAGLGAKGRVHVSASILGREYFANGCAPGTLGQASSAPLLPHAGTVGNSASGWDEAQGEPAAKAAASSASSPHSLPRRRSISPMKAALTSSAMFS
jgi:hypothetical protein